MRDEGSRFQVRGIRYQVFSSKGFSSGKSVLSAFVTTVLIS